MTRRHCRLSSVLHKELLFVLGYLLSLQKALKAKTLFRPNRQSSSPIKPHPLLMIPRLNRPNPPPRIMPTLTINLRRLRNPSQLTSPAIQRLQAHLISTSHPAHPTSLIAHTVVSGSDLSMCRIWE